MATICSLKMQQFMSLMTSLICLVLGKQWRMLGGLLRMNMGLFFRGFLMNTMLSHPPLQSLTQTGKEHSENERKMQAKRP